jgi:hypothetical protein
MSNNTKKIETMKAAFGAITEGTDKQIAYAEDIRANALNDRYINLLESVAGGNTNDMALKMVAVMRMALSEPIASWWINLHANKGYGYMVEAFDATVKSMMEGK